MGLFDVFKSKKTHWDEWNSRWSDYIVSFSCDENEMKCLFSIEFNPHDEKDIKKMIDTVLAATKDLNSSKDYSLMLQSELERKVDLENIKDVKKIRVVFDIIDMKKYPVCLGRFDIRVEDVKRL